VNSQADERQMTCREARRLIAPLLAGDPDIDPRRREAFGAHLLICAACAKEYDQARRLVAILGEDPAQQPGDGSPSAPPEQWVNRPGPNISPPRRAMTREESWEDLLRRAPDLAAAWRRQQARERLRRRVGWGLTAAAAACVVLAATIGWPLLTNRAPHPPVAKQQAPQPQADVAQGSIEVKTAAGVYRLVPGQPFTADRPAEIILDRMHRVILRAGSTASFSPRGGDSTDAAADGLAYLVELQHGEIYVAVTPGHPFEVRTGNAAVFVTGTKFDVAAAAARTTVVLLHGGVRFGRREAPHRYVDLSPGERCSIVGDAPPSPPQRVDALAVTAWAQRVNVDEVPSGPMPEPAADSLLSDRWDQPVAGNLDSVDYGHWLGDNRQWFSREFPWIFTLQSALGERFGIQADYVELLVVSGDIWQFEYALPLGQPIAAFNPAGVARLARHYGVDQTVLLAAAERAGFAEPSSADTSGAQAAPAPRAADAFRRWQADLEAAATGSAAFPGELTAFSLRAGLFVSRTRMTACLWARENPQRAGRVLTDEAYRRQCLSASMPPSLLEGDARAGFLSGQFAAARDAGRLSVELFTAPKAPDCDKQVAATALDLLRCTP